MERAKHLRTSSPEFPGVIAADGQFRISRANGARAYLLQRQAGQGWETVTSAPCAALLCHAIATLGIETDLFAAAGKLPDDPRLFSVALGRKKKQVNGSAKRSDTRQSPKKRGVAQVSPPAKGGNQAA